MMADGVATLHHSPWRPTPMTRFCSIFNQLLQLFPRTEFQQRRAGDAGGAARARISPAGTISSRCCSASSGARSRCARSAAGWPVARASWRISGAAAPPPVDAGLRQCASAVAALSAVFYQVLARCREVARREAVPLQEQAAESRRHGHRPVRGDVSLGDVPPHQRRGEAAFHARSRRLSADLPGDHRRQAPRGADGAASRPLRRARSWSSTRATPTSPGSRT